MRNFLKLIICCLMVSFLVNCQGEEPEIVAVIEASLLEENVVLMPDTENAHEINIELAITPEEQAEGLMFRRELGADAGMLFIFSPPRRASFWMQNTYLSLDMIFIEADGRVQKIAAWTVPLSEEHERAFSDVRAVLELNAGRSEALGLEVGDYIAHPIFNAPEELP